MFLRRYIERFKASCFRQKTRSFSITRVFIIVILFSLVTFFILSYKLMTPRHVRKMPHPPVPKVHCRFERKMQFAPRDHNTRDNLQISKKVLVIAESHYPKLVRQIVQTLELARFDYKIESTGKHLPPLTHLDKGRWSVIIFENLEAYLAMDQWNREMIDKYCKDFKVGMIIFVHSSDELGIDREKVTGFPLILRYNMGLRDFHLNMYSEMWRIARPGEVIDGPLEDDDWTVFEYHNNTYEPLAFARAAPNQFIEGTEQDNSTLVAAILDVGKHDGIKRVFFGNSLEFWLHRLMMVDALSYLSHGKLSLSLDRYIQIDVDDIFVGITGTRMTAADVEAMVQAQERFQKKVEGFMFNMGFSGYYFQTGDNPENEGDKKILEYKNRFWWFGHMWKHEHSHKFPQQRLEQSMLKNYQFAKEMKIPVHHQYAVAPLHAGVFPIHEELYNAWKNVWDIRVTSTEEYPRLHPAWRRRGFIYKGVMVLPRQTCGLFTHTMYFDEYPGGPQVLDKSIQGGELFLTFLFNPINIFMTHMSNYGNDRLALYTFESAFKFVQCWTNLRLKQVPPLEMGIKYFEMYPEEKDPVWRNPCSYKRHLEIWSENKTCDRLPKFMVIGPQKTGTTALYTFLSMHPAILSNYNSSETFEEVQFFNGNNYYKGLDWYMNFFPIPPNATSDFLFEKSATYFDSELAPHRAHALLPKAKLICILIHPAKRAYSWYQHIKAHKDPIAMNHSFYEVITATSLAPQKLQSLRNRCLMPGIYVQHLSRWLDFYPARQLFIVDGEKLKNQPAAVMHNVQRFLHIEPHYEYNDLLRFDPKKGFYCQTMSNNKSKCLGRSKGRKYPPMDQKSMAVLQQFYSKHNVALSHLLEKYKYRIPNWLEQELSSSR